MINIRLAGASLALTLFACGGGEFIIRDSVYTDVFIPEEFNEDQRMVKQQESMEKSLGWKPGRSFPYTGMDCPSYQALSFQGKNPI